MDNYIVRIYRRDEKNPSKLVGIVEEVGVEEKRTFENIDELCEIFRCQREKGTKIGEHKTAEKKKARHGTK